MIPKVTIITLMNCYNEEFQDLKRSVLEQQFSRIEVLIVANGLTSTELKQIRLETQEERFRLIELPEHVEEDIAKNRALEEAKCDYVVFLDTHDILSPKGLMEAYNAAEEADADVVFSSRLDRGFRMDEVNEMLFNMTQKAVFHRYDPHIPSDLNLHNKLLRRSALIDNDIRFRAVGRASDALLLLECLATCDNVTRSRVAFCSRDKDGMVEERLELAITEDAVRNAEEYLKKVLLILDQRMELDLKIAEASDRSKTSKREYRNRMESFRSAVYMNILQLLYDSFYRYIWKMSPMALARLKSLISECYQETFYDDWQELVQANEDLRLNGELLDHNQLAEHPLVSVIVLGHRSDSEIRQILRAYYGQSMPAFELWWTASNKSTVESIYKVENCHFYQEDGGQKKTLDRLLKKMVRGTHVLFLDKMILPQINTLQRLYSQVKGYTFISAPMLHYDSFTSLGQKLDAQNAVFSRRLSEERLRSQLNSLDWTMGNKLFNVKSLRAKKVLFTGNLEKDMYRLYDNSLYIKTVETCFGTKMTNKHILKGPVKLFARLSYKKELAREQKRIELEQQSWRTSISWTRRLKKWIQKQERAWYEYLTIKFVYPMLYRIYSGKKPQDKVLFLVGRESEITLAMKHMYEVIDNTEHYDIKVLAFQRVSLRYRKRFQVACNIIKEIASARYVFVDDTLKELGSLKIRKDTKVVQLWHGCGAFKKFGYSTVNKIFGGDKKQQDRYRNHDYYDICTVSSAEVVWAYEEAMRLEGKNIVKPLGISRTDVFYDEAFIQAAKDRVYEAVPAAREKKVIMYAPTFRGRVSNAKGPDKLDFARLYESLSDEYIILIKHHPLVKKLPDIPVEYRDRFAYDVTRSISTDDLMCAADICISDYSSLIYEYSLFEKPIIMFAYDLDTYFDWRGFYYDYFELSPGPIIVNMDEMVDYIVHIDEKFDRAKMRAFRDKFMSACDGHATERILKEIGFKY